MVGLLQLLLKIDHFKQGVGGVCVFYFKENVKACMKISRVDDDDEEPVPTKRYIKFVGGTRLGDRRSQTDWLLSN